MIFSLPARYLVIAILSSVTFLTSCQSNSRSESLIQTSQVLILVDANLVDVETGRIRENVSILIRGDSIEEISGDLENEQVEGAQTIDIDGRYVIPGLIEGHTHISPLPEKSLTFALEKGVVALRDMGGDGAYLSELKRAIQAGELQGPDIYFSALMGGRELILNDSRVKLATPPKYELGEAPWVRLVENGSDIPQIVRDAENCGATGLKLYAHLSTEQVRQLAGEAKKHNLKIWAHAIIYPATSEEIIEAGVDVISHSCFLLLPPDWEFSDGSGAMDPSHVDSARQMRLFQAMIDKNTALDPTLVVTSQMLSSISDKERVDTLKQSIYALTGAAYKRGVKISAGTDMPLPKRENDPLALHEEMELLVTMVGMRPIDAIRAATIVNAEILGIDESCGSVKEGKRADLIVLEGNPLEDIHRIEDIYFVIKSGRIVN